MTSREALRKEYTWAFQRFARRVRRAQDLGKRQSLPSSTVERAWAQAEQARACWSRMRDAFASELLRAPRRRTSGARGESSGIPPIFVDLSGAARQILPAPQAFQGLPLR